MSKICLKSRQHESLYLRLQQETLRVPRAAAAAYRHGPGAITYLSSVNDNCVGDGKRRRESCSLLVQNRKLCNKELSVCCMDGKYSQKPH